MSHLVEILIPVMWTLFWVGGGWLLAASLFRVRPGEAAMVGLGLGLIAQLWLANVLAHIMPVVASFWTSAVLVLIAGCAGAWGNRLQLRLRPSFSHWILLGGLTLLFFAIGRGLGVFDDYQNLPTVSLMAAGDVPPHFALDPSLGFGYHYLLLLFGAQLMRLGNLHAWTALDLARAISLALPLLLAALWAQRLSGSRVAGFLTACLVAFSGGTRWLLLLLPSSLLQAISDQVSLIGSAASSAPDLAQAMVSSWKIDGAGPIPFPFAFYAGVNQPYIMAYTGIAGSGMIILLLILLTAQRWSHPAAGVVTAMLLGSLAIANEIAFLLLGLGLGGSLAAFWLLGKKAKLSEDMLSWCVTMGSAAVIATLQGGMLTELARGILAGSSGGRSYFDTSLVFVWPPTVVSAHLGSLSLANPAHFVSAVLEIGPVVLVTPLLLVWWWKSLCLRRWYEASLLAGSLGACAALFVSFKGPLYTATPRLMGGWFFAATLYAVPLLWRWLHTRSDPWRLAAASGALVCCLGGLVLFGVQLAAIQAPTYATFITPMDAKMSQDYWNALPPGVWIFDPVVFRAPTVLGRFTKSSPSWYVRTADWQALRDKPDPLRIRAAGFAYMYFDRDYWDGMTSAQRMSFMGSCIKQVAQVDGVRSDKDYAKDFRRLIDIQACR